MLAAQAGIGWRGDISADILDRYLERGKWAVFILTFGLLTIFRQQVWAGDCQALVHQVLGLLQAEAGQVG
jgi:hypothetical protein